MEAIYAGFPPPVQAAMQAMKGCLRPVNRGANNHIFLAAGADGGYMCSGGEYFEDLAPATAHSEAADASLGRRLWEESERLTGVHFDFLGQAAGGPAADGGTAVGASSPAEAAATASSAEA